MALPAIAHQIDHHIAMEMLAERHRHFCGPHHGLRIIGIHMKNRGLDRLGHIGRIGGEAALLRHRRETDLVVDDDVDCPTGSPVRHFGECQRFKNDTLAGKCRVPMDQNGDDFRAVVVTEIVLLGADDAFDHRVDEFKMAGVEAEGDVDFPPADHAILRVTHVVFDVAIPFVFRREKGAFKFAEDRFVRLVQHMGQRVQPSAMRHADDKFIDFQTGAFFDQRVEERDECFTAFDTEPLGTDILLMKELFKALNRDQLKEQ